MPLSLHISLRKKNLNLFATNWCNEMCVCVRLLEWLHWWHTFLCNLLEKRYVIFIISWHCSLGGNFLADTLRYLSGPALSRSWHLAASGVGLWVMSHQAGLLTTLHHIHICFPEQGGNMVTTMGWGFSDFRHLFCFTLLINKACMYHNHIPLMYIFNSPTNECWVSFSFDVVPHQRLLNKLSHYGSCHRSIKSFLSGRTQKVMDDGAFSDAASVASGVPQGTVLRCLSFLLFINDLPSTTSPGTRIRLFVDDCLIYRPLRNSQDQVTLQHDLDNQSNSKTRAAYAPIYSHGHWQSQEEAA